MKVAIYGRPTNNNLSEHIQRLFHKLNEYKTEMLIYEPFYKFLKQKIQISGAIKTFNSHSDLNGDVDFMFSIGGDGTFLETLIFIRDSGIPILWTASKVFCAIRNALGLASPMSSAERISRRRAMNFISSPPSSIRAR